MWRYGQYCPVARALEVVGERWTLLIIRDMMLGTRHFNDLERGLPGISRGLLAKRLKQLEQAGVIEKHSVAGRNSTEYCLTEAGYALENVIESLLNWGIDWAFGDPRPDELNSVLLMWWIHRRVNTDQLPSGRVVVQFNFYGAERASYWLVLTTEEVNLCLTDPGFELNLMVTADLASFFKCWQGRLTFEEAINADVIRIDGASKLKRAFPSWFALSASAPDVKRARSFSG